MLKNMAGVLVLQSFFFVAATSGQAANSDLSPVFQSTEKLMEKENSPFFVTLKQAELLNYMKKYGDTKGVARLSERISVHSSKEKEIGSYTFMETLVAQAEIFLGRTNEAKSRAEKALAHAPTLWLSHGNDRPFNSYINLMGIYLETGGEMSGLNQAKDFLKKVAKGYRDDGWRHQLYQSLGIMWAKAGYISNAHENF